ncbi:MAG: YidC/Oxa1 family membrane protein insertase [Candidatus Dojkabacteria bacterium]
MDIFHNLFYVPIFNLLIFLYQVVGENLGLAVIGVALIAKLITYPLTRRQVKSAGKNQEFQKRSKEIKKKYKDDQEQLTKEMAKIQAEYLPAQLGGCLNLIVVIILLIQVRNVIINLVNQGVHAYNDVAYSESLHLPEDSVTFNLPEEFEEGTHEFKFEISSDNGSKLEQKVPFGYASNGDGVEDVEGQILEQQDNLTEEQRKQLDEDRAEQRRANISLFIPVLEGDGVIVGQDTEVKVFIRPPSGEGINYDDLSISLDDIVLDKDALAITEGTSLNFKFLGADMSLVATDVGFQDLGAVLPYVLISISVGITQFFASRIQAGFGAVPQSEKDDKDDKKKKGKKDKGKDEEDEPDFAEMMQSSTKSMMFVFPVITILMSLGFLGGANFFPTGVSVFWTGQSSFVIIEQLISNRTQILKKLRRE